MTERSKTPNAVKKCTICGKSFPAHELRDARGVRPAVWHLIKDEHPEWDEHGLICRKDLGVYRRRHVENLLENERGEISDLDQQVLDNLEQGSILARNPLDVPSSQLTIGERMADGLAAFGGSWRFISIFAFVLIAWMVLNISGWLFQPFDTYPFILLNLALSSLAALQAPVIMMSQKRKEARDRLTAENDYRVNLKAELEIRQLHEKIDHQMSKQWERLAEIQQIQMEMLEEQSSKE